MRYFSHFIKEMNMLVRLAWYLNFGCHFLSDVAGNVHLSSW